MIQHIRKFTGIFSALALMLVCADAMAGAPSIGTITYAPILSMVIPALSGPMLVVLSLLFAVIAFRVLRARTSNKPLASIMAMAILTLAAFSGIHLVRSAQAAIFSVVFNSSSGGSVPVRLGLSEVTNNTGQPQKITNISISPGYTTNSPYPSTPECTVGLGVANQGYCYIYIVSSFC